MDLGISGKRALVLGGTSGLGNATAAALAAEGARVVLTGRDAVRAAAAAAELPGAIGMPYDISIDGAPDDLWKRVSAQLDAVDILVLNSGGPQPTTAAGASIAQVKDVIDTHLLAHIQLVALALPAMLRARWGRIIGIGSSGVQAPIPNLALSNIGRSAFAAYLKTLSAEVAPSRVTVNMVLPGRIDTDRVASLDKATGARESIDPATVRKQTEAAIPARRYGTPQEFAAVVAFLAGTTASYVTGEQVRVDGGSHRAY